MKYLVKTSLGLFLVLLSVFTLATNAYADGAKRILIVMSSESAMGISGKKKALGLKKSLRLTMSCEHQVMK